MGKFKYWLIGAALALILYAISAALIYKSKSDKLGELVAMQKHFIESNNTAFRVADSLNALEVVTLQLRGREFKERAAENAELLDDLGAELKRVTSQVSLNLQGVYHIETKIYDSILIDSIKVLDTVACISIDEQYINVSGCLQNGVFMGKITTLDSLLYIEHITPRKFLFLKWGCKERRQTIINKNKNSEVVSAEFISKRGK